MSSYSWIEKPFKKWRRKKRLSQNKIIILVNIIKDLCFLFIFISLYKTFGFINKVKMHLIIFFYVLDHSGYISLWINGSISTPKRKINYSDFICYYDGCKTWSRRKTQWKGSCYSWYIRFYALELQVKWAYDVHHKSY